MTTSELAIFIGLCWLVVCGVGIVIGVGDVPMHCVSRNIHLNEKGKPVHVYRDRAGRLWLCTNRWGIGKIRDHS